MPLFLPQSDLPKHPKYNDYITARREIANLDSKANGVQATGFSADGKAVLLNNGKQMVIASGAIEEATAPANNPGLGRRQGGPSRGRQFTSAVSPDGKLTAKYADNNITLESPSGKVQITKDGSAQARIKYGTASWVYGEELGQNQAMWWSGDSKTLVYYRFDESKVQDYFLTTGQNGIYNRLYTEAYPKAGTPNPTVQLFAYDVASGKSKEIDTKFASTDPDIAHYVYNVQFAPDGKTLLYNRTNRKQNVMELCAASLETGKSRVVAQESNPNGWVDNSPAIRWLSDGDRFVWTSERNGYANFWLGSLSKGLQSPITTLQAEVVSILRLDESKKELWYTARDGENPYLVQLHRVGLDGKNDRRLTEPSTSHTVTISPDGSMFIDRAVKIGGNPMTTVRDREGKLITGVSKGDIWVYSDAKYSPAERFTVVGSDGKTPIYGYFCKPRNFDATKKYPLLLRVYGGPESGGSPERLIGPDAVCELGFITAWIDAKGTKGRGRDFTQSVYGKLGVVEIDDTAAAVTDLCKKYPFIDSARVGVEGTSYGGYFSALSLLRHPEVYAAACASSAVTSWWHYDTIYTERYMDTPQNNPEGYKAGSAMEFAGNLKGQLCLFYGTADDNVHPTNTHQLIAALDKEGKPYRLYVGVDQGHAALRQDRMLEFFIQALKP